MGRGRAKAKQTKVARQLKYSSGGTNLDRLQAELRGSSGEPHHVDAADDELTDVDGDDVEDDEEYGGHSARR